MPYFAIISIVANYTKLYENILYYTILLVLMWLSLGGNFSVGGPGWRSLFSGDSRSFRHRSLWGAAVPFVPKRRVLPQSVNWCLSQVMIDFETMQIPQRQAIFFLWLAGLCLWGTLIYSNTFQVPFVFDDELFILQNQNLRNIMDPGAQPAPCHQNR